MNKKKRFGFLAKFACWFFGVLFVLVIASPIWLGPVAKFCANIIVPNITGTPFKISELSVNPFSGYVHVGGVVLENPDFFENREAFTLGDLDVKLSFASLLTDVIKIKEIAVSDVYVAYFSEKGTNNFDVIIANASGEAKPEKPVKSVSVEVPAKKSSGEKSTAKSDGISIDASKFSDKKAQVDLVEVEKDAAQDSSQKKVEIDHLSINGLSVKFAFIKIPIPPISISNLGKDTGGISLKGLWSEILSIVMKSAGAVGGAVSDFGASLLNGTSNAAQDAANVLIDAGSSVKDIGKSLKNFFK
jgi:hypothetical protein